MSLVNTRVRTQCTYNKINLSGKEVMQGDVRT